MYVHELIEIQPLYECTNIHTCTHVHAYNADIQTSTHMADIQAYICACNADNHIKQC